MRSAKPEKFCPNCSLLHARWGETCRERLMAEVRSLRAELAAARAPSSLPEAPRDDETAIEMAEAAATADAMIAALPTPRRCPVPNCHAGMLRRNGRDTVSCPVCDGVLTAAEYALLDHGGQVPNLGAAPRESAETTDPERRK